MVVYNVVEPRSLLWHHHSDRLLGNGHDSPDAEHPPSRPAGLSGAKARQRRLFRLAGEAALSAIPLRHFDCRALRESSIILVAEVFNLRLRITSDEGIHDTSYIRSI